MVAIVKSNTSIRRTIAYNENKVKKGQAQLIYAGNYPVDLHKISAKMKIQRFVKRTELNQKTKRNTVHISLNFSPLDQPCRETLVAIARFYMERIGFGQQPYLVYQHFDAGHPHLHLVSVNIQAQGRRIDLHKILVDKSIPATREIEKYFGLINAGRQSTNPKVDLSPIVSRIHYGETESKKAITQVLDCILKRYSYTSLSELNALLGQYNLLADRGKENSKTFQSGGLLYKILTPQGKPIGIPLKASDVSGKPTLKFLETQFKINAAKNKMQKTRLKNIIILSLQRHPNISQDNFFKMLQKQAITVIEQNNLMGIAEIIYIDHKTKCVCNNNALGLSYDIAKLKKSSTVEPQLYDNKKLSKKNYLRKL